MKVLVLFSKFVTRVCGCSTEGLEGPLAGASEDRLESWVPLDPAPASPPPSPVRNHVRAVQPPQSQQTCGKSGWSKARLVFVALAGHSHAGDGRSL